MSEDGELPISHIADSADHPATATRRLAVPARPQLRRTAVPAPPQLRRIAIPGDPDGPRPEVGLIDALIDDLDERALRSRARAAAATPGARWSSRSYSFPLALIAWHDRPVGVDVERVSRCDRAFVDSILTPAERDTIAPQAALDGYPRDGEHRRLSAPEHVRDPDRFYTSLWSAKEALSKALGDPLAYDPRRLEGPGGWPGGRSGPWRAAALAIDADHVAWVCWRVDGA